MHSKFKCTMWASKFRLHWFLLQDGECPSGQECINNQCQTSKYSSCVCVLLYVHVHINFMRINIKKDFPQFFWYLWYHLRRSDLVAVRNIGSLVFFYVCISNINGVPSIFMLKKNPIPERDSSETGTISKNVSNVAFLYEIYREKGYFSHLTPI